MRNYFFYPLVFLYLFGPLLFFIAKISLDYDLNISWLKNNIKIYETIQNIFLGLVFFSGSITFGLAFWKDGAFKYNLSDISGIIGIVISLLSLSMMLIWSVFFWGFVLSGILCLYAACAPLLNAIYRKMEGNSWEKGTITAALSFFILFIISYKSNILLNNLFLVDPKHFPFTKIITGFVVASPVCFIISFISLLILSFKLMRLRNESGTYSFWMLNGMLASMTVFTLSFTLSLGGDKLIKNVASTVDFNSKNICSNVEANIGVIYLDNKYDLILLDTMKAKEHYYSIQKCVKKTSPLS